MWYEEMTRKFYVKIIFRNLTVWLRTSLPSLIARRWVGPQTKWRFLPQSVFDGGHLTINVFGPAHRGLACPFQGVPPLQFFFLCFFVRLWFYIWSLFCHYLFISPFGAAGRLFFVIVGGISWVSSLIFYQAYFNKKKIPILREKQKYSSVGRTLRYGSYKHT